MLSYLTGRQITKACARAQSCNEHRLALLMSQAVSSHHTRIMLTEQLQAWARYKVCRIHTFIRLFVVDCEYFMIG